jgi:hypothetical protein
MTEVRIEDEITLGAPIGEVWQAIDDPRAQAHWHPFVRAITGGHELGELRSCSVQLGRTAGTTKERCVERDDGARLTWAIEEDSTGFGRMVTAWRSGFLLAEHGSTTIVIAQSSFRPNHLFVRVALPLIRRRFHRTQRAILRGLQQAVERAS